MDPVPDIKLPAFALVVDLKPDDDDFAIRLKVAFQSFVGLANLGAAQTKAPPLDARLGDLRGRHDLDRAIHAPAQRRPRRGRGQEPVHQRHNFSPSAAQVGDHFILSSSVGLARDLIKALEAPRQARRRHPRRRGRRRGPGRARRAEPRPPRHAEHAREGPRQGPAPRPRSDLLALRSWPRYLRPRPPARSRIADGRPPGWPTASSIARSTVIGHRLGQSP